MFKSTSYPVLLRDCDYDENVLIFVATQSFNITINGVTHACKTPVEQDHLLVVCTSGERKDEFVVDNAQESLRIIARVLRDDMLNRLLHKKPVKRISTLSSSRLKNMTT